MCTNDTSLKTVVYTQGLSFTFWTLPWGTNTKYDDTTNTLQTTVRAKSEPFTYYVKVYDRNGTKLIDNKYTGNTGVSAKSFNLTGIQKPARVEITDGSNHTLHFVNVGNANYLQSIQAFANQNLSIDGFNLLALMPLIFAAIWTRNTVGIGSVVTVVMIMTMVWFGLISIPDAVLYLMLFIALIGVIAYKVLF
jgi:hypothetical protein